MTTIVGILNLIIVRALLSDISPTSLWQPHLHGGADLNCKNNLMLPIFFLFF